MENFTHYFPESSPLVGNNTALVDRLARSAFVGPVVKLLAEFESFRCRFSKVSTATVALIWSGSSVDLPRASVVIDSSCRSLQISLSKVRFNRSSSHVL